jgi:hypothetical protein
MGDTDDRDLAEDPSVVRADHWGAVYATRAPDEVSWYQAEPVMSLALIGAVAPAHDVAVVDVGGGASLLVDALVARGFPHVTVVDVADRALDVGRRRLGPDTAVDWVAADVLTWRPTRSYGVWHDRAVLHFLSGGEVDRYVAILERALAPTGTVVLGAFAPDGPTHCSGLPVTRYDADGLAAVLGARFSVVESRREVHVTPSGAEQPFTWIAARRRA